MAVKEAPRYISPLDNQAICRHFQFSDMHNGSWYIEIFGGSNPTEFFIREIRNGVIVRHSREPKSFAECRKIFWNRSHKMSIEAGFESAPPKPEIVWK